MNLFISLAIQICLGFFLHFIYSISNISAMFLFAMIFLYYFNSYQNAIIIYHENKKDPEFYKVRNIILLLCLSSVGLLMFLGWSLYV